MISTKKNKYYKYSIIFGDFPTMKTSFFLIKTLEI